MHISCPHCHATYKVGPLIRNAILVCHRCRTEFSLDDRPIAQQQPEEADTEHSLPLFEHVTGQQERVEKKVEPTDGAASQEVEYPHADNQPATIPVPAFLEGDHKYAGQVEREKPSAKPDAAEEEKISAPAETACKENSVADADQPSPEKPKGAAGNEASPPLQETVKQTERAGMPLPPARQHVVIWPWLIAMLLLIGGAGFWQKQDAWLDHPWLRSVLINMHLPVEVRNKDWFIIPASVQGHWLKRDDGSQVLTIQGRIENRLYCELPPPQILVQFFDDTGLTESLGEKLLPITEPPSMEQIKHAPFVMPEKDRIPVEARGQRGFFLVVESMPERTADFTLMPVVSASTAD